jgi:hypothetical protein
MRGFPLLILASALSFGAAPLHADIGEGNWEMDVTVTMPGLPPGGQSVKQNHCLRAEDGRDPAKLFGDPGAGCQFTDRSDTGSMYRFKIVCSGATKVDGTGEVNYSRDTMNGQIVLNMTNQGQSVQTRTSIKARRTGPCVTSR